jgi:hypothetical protein
LLLRDLYGEAAGLPSTPSRGSRAVLRKIPRRCRAYGIDVSLRIHINAGEDLIIFAAETNASGWRVSRCIELYDKGIFSATSSNPLERNI